MKNLRFIIFLLVLALFFGLSLACSDTKIEKVEDISVTEKPIEEPQEIEDPTAVKESEEEIAAVDNDKLTSRENPAILGETFLVSMDDWIIGKVTIEVEMMEVISGDQAWEMVKKANQFNERPEEDKEYILAKFRIKVIETEEDEPFEINHAKFDVISGGGVEYTDFIVVSGLKPDLRADLYEGADHEGWTYFMVNKDDDNPLAVFERRKAAEIWFKLRS